MPSAIDIRGSGSLAPYLFCIVFPALPVSSCARLVPMVLIKEQNCRNFRMLIDEFLGCENLALQPINLCSGDIRTASGDSLAVRHTCSAASRAASSRRSEEHTSELPSLMRISYAV